jgi:hypothetical protein
MPVTCPAGSKQCEPAVTPIRCCPFACSLVAGQAQPTLVWKVASGMDVRLVSDEGVEQRPVEEFQALLQREDGLVWVDIPGHCCIERSPFPAASTRPLNTADRGHDRVFQVILSGLAIGRASTPLPFADAFRLNATVPPARPGRTRVPGRSGQPAKVGGVFGRLADLQYSQGLASGSIARSMSLTDHSDRPSAVM